MKNTPKLTDDGSRTLDSARYSQTYHSINGALTEARHVFLDASGVSARLQQGLSTQVLEIGFGAGLNALLTADLASLHGAPLNYHAFEHDLPSTHVIRQLRYDELLAAPELFEALLLMIDQATLTIRSEDEAEANEASAIETEAVQAKQSPGDHSGNNRVDQPAPPAFNVSDNARVHLHLRDAASTCFKTACNTRFHAIYLDAFSADANPECWSPEFISKLASVLTRGGRLSTYSARGHVRRAMLAAGLQVEKLPGPPGKREMLVGYW